MELIYWNLLLLNEIELLLCEIAWLLTLQIDVLKEVAVSIVLFNFLNVI